MRRETPPARGLFGISTRKRPARLMNVVSAAPLLPLLLLDLHQELLTLGQELTDVHAAVRCGPKVLLRDFLERQEPVALGAVIDEAGFERRLDAGDASL